LSCFCILLVRFQGLVKFRKHCRGGGGGGSGGAVAGSQVLMLSQIRTNLDFNLILLLGKEAFEVCL
jgi:hypothetical protein